MSYKKLPQLAIFIILGLSLSACSTSKNFFGKRDNGSLKYQQSHLLEPIKMPVEQKNRPFVPLYPTIDMGKSSINLTNEAGKQYRLPKP